MKNLKNSRPFAALCLAVIIVLSVFLGGLRAVKKVEKKAYNAYYSYDENFGKASDDIKKLSRYASMLYAVCEAGGCAEEDFGVAVDRFDKSAGEPYVSQELYNSLYYLCSFDYNLLVNGPNVDEQLKTSAKQYYYEIEAIVKRLAKNETYNNAAKKYNSAISGYPMRLVMKHADPMVVFD